MIRLEIPGTPTAKGRPRFSRASGRAYTPAKTAEAELGIKVIAALAMAGAAPFNGPLCVQMHAYFPVPASWSRKKRDAALTGVMRPTGKPDCDNLLKILDALNEIVWRDDAQVVDARVTKGYDARPRTVIVVQALGGGQ